MPKQQKQYSSYNQASKAARALGINTSGKYRSTRTMDPRLPFDPRSFYAADWVSWQEFLGTDRTYNKKSVSKFGQYATLKEASKAAQKLGIKTSNEYQAKYKQDPKLRASLKQLYASEWTGWVDFLGTHNRPRSLNPRKPADHYYQTFEKAANAAKKLHAVSARDYISKYQQDSRLPSNPSMFYKEDWVSWDVYLGRDPRKKQTKYPTYKQASKAAVALGISNSRDYLKNYKKDPRLPSNPDQKYSDWKGWADFVKVKKR